MKAIVFCLLMSAAGCMAAAIFDIDTSCNPGVDPPTSGGCTWNNFTANTDGSITDGGPFTGYYVAAGSIPPWTFTLGAGGGLFRIVDGGHQGDAFTVFDNSVSLGLTSTPWLPGSPDFTHQCPVGSETAANQGTNPATCWNDPAMSQGTFVLGPGSHSITLQWTDRVPGGVSTLQWFEVQSTPSTVPDPGTLSLIGMGLMGVGLTRYRARGRKR